MKNHLLIIILILSITLSSCTKFERDTLPLNLEINDFVWKGMNTYYLWQDSIPALNDNRFSLQEDLYSYLSDYDQPAELFASLKHKPDEVDKWSWIVDDYIALEAYFNGMRKTSGAKIGLYWTNSDEYNIYGIIRYVIPNTDAANTPIERGDVFNSVNGVILNKSNYQDLLYTNDSYTLNLGIFNFNAGTQTVEITQTGESVTLNNGSYAENPIHQKTVFNVDGHTIGYLMYNSFTSNYNQDLNNAFQYLKNENISDLILDLRYNGGGSVQTASYLASMITGQFEGQILTKEKWNSKWQSWLEENHPDWLVNHFTNTMNDGTTIHNLNLNRIIILTTKNSASASELVINALKPYIEVVTIGMTTHGKYVASVTLYDSPTFSKENVNPDHLWAMQPIVLKELNSEGQYAFNGFEPNIVFDENFNNMGVLGSETEPLTERAINYIVTGNKTRSFINKYTSEPTRQIISLDGIENEMYVEKQLPLERI